MSDECEFCKVMGACDRHVREKLAAAEARLRESEEALRVACEALTWYGTSENYMHEIRRNKRNEPEVCEATWRPVVLDAGKRSRDALAEIAKLRGDAGKGEST